MVISRPEHGAAQFAARDVGKIPLDRVGLGDVDLVKIGLREAKGVALQKLSIHRERAIFAQLQKRRVSRRGKANVVARRFFQEKAGESEE